MDFRLILLKEISLDFLGQIAPVHQLRHTKEQSDCL